MPSSLFPQQVVNRANQMSPLTPQLLNVMQQPQPQQVQQPAQQNREQILQLWRTVRNSTNPQQAFEQLLSTNPDLKRTVEMIKSLGNPEQLFYTMAKQQGTDPNTVLNLLK